MESWQGIWTRFPGQSLYSPERAISKNITFHARIYNSEGLTFCSLEEG